MVSWPAGHRWEDYQVRIYDKGFTPLGALATVHNMRGSVARWGQYGTNLTFSLEKNDPWATVLNESQVHFVNVIRSGTSIWGGYQVKLDREHDRRRDGEETWLEFVFLPLARMLGWRWGYESSAGFLDISGVKIDDAFKDIVDKVIGSSAPTTPTNAVSLTLSGLVVAADKTQHPTDATFTGDAGPRRQDIYEWMQERATVFDVDFDIYWNGDVPTFETWYPQRGLDRTEGNGSNAECIFNDTDGSIVVQSYGWDTADAVTGVYSADFSSEVLASAGDRTNWLLRMRAVDSTATGDLNAELENYKPVIWYEMREFCESVGKQWGVHFNVGDKCTWRSHEMGYGPANEYVAKIEFEIDKDGAEHRNLILSETRPEPPDNNDKMRGGGGRKRRIRYTDPQNPDSVGAHTLLDGDRHSDTATDAATRGSLVVGGTAATALWDELVVGGVGTFLASDGTDPAWRTLVAGDIAAHDIVGAQHTGTGDQYDVVGFSAGNTLGVLDSASAPGATVKILRTDGSGYVRPERVEYGAATHYVGYSGNWLHVEGAATGGVSFRISGTEICRVSASSFTANSGENLGSGAEPWGDVFVNTAKGIIHTDGVAAGQYLRADGTRYVPNTIQVGDLPSHNLLSATHGDTVASVMTRGDLVVGTAGGWDDLAVGAANTTLVSDGTDPSWGTPNLLSAYHGDTTTSACTRGDVIIGNASGEWDDLAVGAASTFLLSNGTDPSWGTVTLLGPYHSDTATAVPQRGDLIKADATPQWQRIAIGGNGTFLASNGTDPAWRVLAASDIDGLSDPGTCTVATGNAAGTPHTHAITSSSDPGAAASILACDASGYLELVRLEIATDGNYLWRDVSGHLTARVTSAFQVDDAGTLCLYVTSAGVRSVGAGGNLGTAADPWGDLYIATAKGIIHADGVTAGKYLRANGTRYIPANIVEADLPSHDHTGVTGSTQPTISGDTSDWEAGGSEGNRGSTAVRDSGLAERFFYMADDAVPTNPRWEKAYIPQTSHWHQLSGDVTGGAHTATAAVQDHTHTVSSTV
jgi:hypothetical protein